MQKTSCRLHFHHSFLTPYLSRSIGQPTGFRGLPDRRHCKCQGSKSAIFPANPTRRHEGNVSGLLSLTEEPACQRGIPEGRSLGSQGSVDFVWFTALLEPGGSSPFFDLALKKYNTVPHLFRAFAEKMGTHDAEPLGRINRCRCPCPATHISLPAAQSFTRYTCFSGTRKKMRQTGLLETPAARKRNE